MKLVKGCNKKDETRKNDDHSVNNKTEALSPETEVIIDEDKGKGESTCSWVKKLEQPTFKGEDPLG